VTKFLILENVQPQQIYKQMTVVYGEDVPSYPMVTCGAVDHVEAEEAVEMSDEPQSVGHPRKAVCKVGSWQDVFCKENVVLLIIL